MIGLKSGRQDLAITQLQEMMVVVGQAVLSTLNAGMSVSHVVAADRAEEAHNFLQELADLIGERQHL